LDDYTTVPRQELALGLENIRKAIQRYDCRFSKKTRNKITSSIRQVTEILRLNGDEISIKSRKVISLRKHFELCKAEAERTGPLSNTHDHAW